MYEKMRLYTYYAAAIALLASFSFGFQVAIISGVLPFAASEFILQSSHQGFVVSSILLGAILGVFLSAIIADTMGRKPALQIQALLFLIGTAMCFHSGSFYVLLIGRFISGLGLGIASTVVPLYLSEISPPPYRGRLVTSNQIMITAGVLCAFLVNYILAPSSSWRTMLGAGLIPCILQLILLFFMEESPFWYLSKGDKDNAAYVFKRLRKDSLWMQSLIAIDGMHSSTVKTSFFKMMKNKKVLFVILIGMGINMFQQITGINAVIFYSPKILEQTGFSSLDQAIKASIAIGVVNLVCSTLAAMFIDKIGRRKLLMMSLAGMLFFLQLILASMLFFSSDQPLFILCCILGYIGFFSLGLGPITFVIVSELYPLAIRGKAMSLAIFSNWFFNSLLSVSFPLLIEKFGVVDVFKLFVILIALAFLFVYRCVPETKGRSLAEIEYDLQ